jgi:hypothetical protein
MYASFILSIAQLYFFYPACYYLSYGETPLVNCGPRSIPYIAITIYYLLALFTFLQIITFYHSIRLILCSQQTGEIDNLTMSWDKVLGCVMCRLHVAAGEKLHADKFPGAIIQSVAKLAGINLRKFGSFSYWFDKPWFHN